jgi:hypothetical protein
LRRITEDGSMFNVNLETRSIMRNAINPHFSKLCIRIISQINDPNGESKMTERKTQKVWRKQ